MHEDILSTISSIHFTYEQKLRIKLIKDHIDCLTNKINNLRNIIDTLIAPYKDYINLIMTIPGIDTNSAITILSEIGVDMYSSNHYRLTS